MVPGGRPPLRRRAAREPRTAARSPSSRSSRTQDGAVSLPPQLYGRKLAMDELLDAGGDRVALYGLTSEAGYPMYVHSKVCVIDDVWASVGLGQLQPPLVDRATRRSRPPSRTCASRTARARAAGRLRTAAAAGAGGEHLGLHPDDVPDDPDGTSGTSWPPPPRRSTSGTRRGRARGRRHLPHLGARCAGPRCGGAARAPGGAAGVERPPGRLRRLVAAGAARGSSCCGRPRLYDVFDPDGTVLRDDRI